MSPVDNFKPQHWRNMREKFCHIIWKQYWRLPVDIFKSQGGKNIRETLYHIIGKYELVASQAVDIFKSLGWRFNVVAPKIDGEY